jgi:ribosomal protein L16 Arg81 hydroxylase
VTWKDGNATHAAILNPGDTLSMPEHILHTAVPAISGEASLFHVVATGDPAGPTWKG